MPRECAFCPNVANTREHVWSDWINGLLPGRKRFNIRNNKREIVKTWSAPELNWKRKVVCDSCNGGWMSRLENDHAKPSLSDLIIGKTGILIDQNRARSIALFAFKTAVIFDHLAKDQKPFFDRDTRHEFGRTLAIPPNVGVHVAHSALKGRGEANTLYFEGDLPAPYLLHAYILTYSIERVVLQVAACKIAGIARAGVENKFGVTIWPKVPDGFFWPAARSISTIEEFDGFSDRWNTVSAALLEHDKSPS